MYGNEKQIMQLHDCKLDAFMELLEQLDGEPVMAFYGFKHDLDRILERLAKTKLRVRVYEGAKDEDDWNAGKMRLLRNGSGDDDKDHVPGLLSFLRDKYTERRCSVWQQ